MVVLLAAAALANPVDLGLGDTIESSWGAEFEIVDLHPATHDIDGIWGGQTTIDYPNVVALAEIANWGGYIFCSGTLIQNRWVITAAHCLDGQSGALARGDLYILFGNDILRNGYDDSVKVSEFHLNPDYDGANFRNDIALVELVRDKNGVDFAVLNDEPLTIDWYDKLLTFVGFGITIDNAQDTGTKRETDIPIDTYDSSYVYSEDGLSNVCQGDSGGPAFETTNAGNLELVGINAFVYPGCEGGGNGATRVDAYMDFILGYVPDVILGGSGEGSGGSDDGGNSGGGDNPFNGEVDMDSYDRDFGDVTTPAGASYPKAIRCATGPVPSSLGWLALLGAVGVLTRRRSAAT